MVRYLQKSYEYEAPLPHQPAGACYLKEAWARVPPELNGSEKQALQEEIKILQSCISANKLKAWFFAQMQENSLLPSFLTA